MELAATHVRAGGSSNALEPTARLGDQSPPAAESGFDPSPALPTWPTDTSIGTGEFDWYLFLLLGLSAIGSLVVFLLAFGAFRRRRSMPYLLITAALGALVFRPIVGTGTALGYVSMTTHHTVEHLLDVLIAGFLICAILSVGALESPSEPDSDPDQRADGGITTDMHTDTTTNPEEQR